MRLRRKTAAVFFTPQTKEVLSAFGGNIDSSSDRKLARVFNPRWLFRDMEKSIAQRFKKAARVSDQDEAARSRPDIIIAINNWMSVKSLGYRTLKEPLGTKLELELGATILAPSGEEIDAISVRTEDTKIIWSARSAEAVEREALARFGQAFLGSAKLRAFVERGRLPPLPGPDVFPPTEVRSDVDKPAFSPKPEAEDDFAVVVGVEGYQRKGLPQARFAARDAQSISLYLRTMGVKASHMKILIGSDATAASVRSVLLDWLPKNVRPASRVFFYFSGHGAPDPRGSAYLVPWDGDPSSLDHTAVRVTDVYAELGKLPVKRVLAMMDSCFSGAGARSALPEGARPLVTMRSDLAVPRGMKNLTVLTAGGKDQITGTFDAQGHGIFTYFLLKGLNEGTHGVARLCRYLRKNVREQAALSNGEQTPICSGRNFSF